jgi:hypothetical protein
MAGAVVTPSLPLITSQVVDSINVYVGGTRCQDGAPIYWSLKAFSLMYGSLQWRRDLNADAISVLGAYTNGEVVKLCIDPTTGYIVAMLKPSGTNQAFIVIDTSGNLVAVRTYSTTFSSAQYPAFDFCINEDGDYHMLCNNGQSGWEWQSPFSGSPSFRNFYVFGSNTSAICIRRLSGRDWYGLSANAGAGSYLFLKGAAQRAMAYTSTSGHFDAAFVTPIAPSADYATDIALDGSGNIFVAGSKPTVSGQPYIGGSLRKFNSSGVVQWEVPCAGRGVAVDSSGNVYSSGDSRSGAISFASIRKQSNSGTYNWGHISAVGFAQQQIAVDGTSGVIHSGVSESTGFHALKANAINFIPNPCGSSCSGVCRYSASLEATATVYDYTFTTTWTAPSGGTIVAIAFGGGGAGGGGGSGGGGAQGADGGGSGEYATSSINVSSGDVFTITVTRSSPAAGGVSGNANDNGEDGADVTIACAGISGFVTVIAKGGKGGIGYNMGGGVGVGGTGGAGQVHSAGQNGFAHSGNTGGAGGNNTVNGNTGGAGGISSGSFHDGSVGTDYAAGGGGGAKFGNGGAGGLPLARISFKKFLWNNPTNLCLGSCGSCAAVDSTFYSLHGYPSSNTDILDIVCS